MTGGYHHGDGEGATSTVLPPPMFSIVIPTYNRRAEVGQAIASCLAQTSADIEVIVVDDASTDGTVDTLARIGDPRLRWLRHEVNRGRCVARNTGLHASRGNFTVFLDSDDRAGPDWIETLSSRVRPAVGVVCCGARIHDGDASRVILPAGRGPVYYDFDGLFLAGTFAARRALLIEAGGYLEGLDHGENTELAIRLLRACAEKGIEVSSVGTPLVTVSRPASPRLDPLVVASSTERLLASHGEHYLRVRPAGYARLCAIAGVAHARNGKHGRAIRLLGRAVRRDPRRMAHWLRLALAILPGVGNYYWNRHPPSDAASGNAL